MEPDGSITVNECGLVDGKPVKLVSHPKFRIFLTIDPKHGEVSRAMRNRGLEIFMMHPNWFDETEVNDCDNSEINDVRKFLVLSGIPFNRLILAMSEAHMYAKNAGLRLGVRITLLELSRWTQLFQQLLMNGNQPGWSLQVSWEHTYLSSLGDAEGRDTIEQAKFSCLSDSEWYKSDMTLGHSLSLPGGWPSPHSVRNFVCYSREASIRENCVYLEFLASQYGAYKLDASQNITSTWDKHMNTRPSLLPKNIVHHLLFPNIPYQQKLAECDVTLINHMLSFAANWTLEQATENDFPLYVQWFNWCNNKLLPYCHFFETFLKILEEERDHPIWLCIFKCRKKIISHHKLDVHEPLIPLLSAKSVELAGLDGSLMKCKKLLDNALHCVPLLRLTYWHWIAEDYYANREVLQYSILPIITSLRGLESKVLRVIIESRKLMQTYSNLLQHHILFWKSFTSSHFEHLSVIWCWLKKEALKLQPRFPEAVSALLVSWCYLALTLNQLSLERVQS